MNVFIGMEDLVANALIEVLEHKTAREIDFDTLSEYGFKVVSFLMKRHRKAVLLLSDYYRNELIRNYSDYFKYYERDNKCFIAIQDGVYASDLRNQFRAYLSIDMLLAFVNKDSLEALGVNYGRQVN